MGSAGSEKVTRRKQNNNYEGHQGTRRPFHKDLRGTSCPSWFRNLSAGELVAGKLQAVQVPQGGHRNRFSLEELLRQSLQVFDRDGLNLFDEFVKIVKAVEIHFLACQVRHAGGARLERKHQASLELIL